MILLRDTHTLNTPMRIEAVHTKLPASSKLGAIHGLDVQLVTGSMMSGTPGWEALFATLAALAKLCLSGTPMQQIWLIIRVGSQFSTILVRLNVDL